MESESATAELHRSNSLLLMMDKQIPWFESSSNSSVVFSFLSSCNVLSLTSRLYICLEILDTIPEGGKLMLNGVMFGLLAYEWSEKPELTESDLLVPTAGVWNAKGWFCSTGVMYPVVPPVGVAIIWDPELESDLEGLRFKSPFTSSATSSITITNDSQTSIAFKVKTTAPKLYCVRPNASIVRPGSSLDVSIIFQGLAKEPAIGTKCKDKFLIVSVPCSEDLDPKSISSIWSDLQSQAGSTSDVKVKVVFNYSSLNNTIQEESSQQTNSGSKDASTALAGAAGAAGVAGVAGTSLANGSAGSGAKSVPEKNAVPADGELQESTPLASSSPTDPSTTTTTAAPVSKDAATSTNVYILALLFVVLAFLYAKFFL